MDATVSSESEEPTKPKERTPRGWQQYWEKEYAAARKRARTFQKQGNQVSKRFLDARANDSTDLVMDQSVTGRPYFRLNL